MGAHTKVTLPFHKERKERSSGPVTPTIWLRIAMLFWTCFFMLLRRLVSLEFRTKTSRADEKSNLYHSFAPTANQTSITARQLRVT